MLIKYASFEVSIFDIMDNGSVAVEAGFFWAFQYVAQFESWFALIFPLLIS